MSITERSAIEVAWAAGLFEGEGCIVHRRQAAAELILGTTDEDVAERLHRIMGCGTLNVEVRQAPHRTLYRWSLCEGSAITEVLTALLPYFGERRRQRALDTLERLRNNRGRNADKTHCKRGHEYTPENTSIDRKGSRVCITCRRERQRKQPVG